MSKMLAALAVTGAATGTIATGFIWTLLTDPTTIANALADGSVKLLVTALFGGQ